MLRSFEIRSGIKRSIEVTFFSLFFTVFGKFEVYPIGISLKNEITKKMKLNNFSMIYYRFSFKITGRESYIHQAFLNFRK